MSYVIAGYLICAVVIAAYVVSVMRREHALKETFVGRGIVVEDSAPASFDDRKTIS